MAHEIHIGVDGTARQISRIYIGVGNKARSVKKAYIGVNGKARLIFSRKLYIEYSLLTHDLSNAKRSFAAGSIRNYAIFAGGMGASTSTRYSSVDAYDSSYIKSTPTSLSYPTSSIAGASIDRYMIAAGGYKSNGYSKIVTSYNSSLTKQTLAGLQSARSMPCGCGSNKFGIIIIAGGQTGTNSKSNAVDAFDSNMTKTTLPVLSVARSSLGGATVGDKILFAGGYGSTSSPYRSAVDAYDTLTLTRTILSPLSEARDTLGTASTTKYAIFAGGATSKGENNPSAVIDYYDATLTRNASPKSLQTGRYFLAGGSVNEYALFGGGKQGQKYNNKIEIFDEDLVYVDYSIMSPRSSFSTAKVGNSLLFAGGSNGDNSVGKDIDVITISDNRPDDW